MDHDFLNGKFALLCLCIKPCHCLILLFSSLLTWCAQLDTALVWRIVRTFEFSYVECLCAGFIATHIGIMLHDDILGFNYIGITWLLFWSLRMMGVVTVIMLLDALPFFGRYTGKFIVLIIIVNHA